MTGGPWSTELDALTAQNKSDSSLNTASGLNSRVASTGMSLGSAGGRDMRLWSDRVIPAWANLASGAYRGPQSDVDRAAADVSMGFDKSKGVLDRSLGRMGINPNSGRFVGLNTKWGLARAAAEAAAMTRARSDAEREANRSQTALFDRAAVEQARAAGLARDSAYITANARQAAMAEAERRAQLAAEAERANELKKAQEDIRRQKLFDDADRRIADADADFYARNKPKTGLAPTTGGYEPSNDPWGVKRRDAEWAAARAPRTEAPVVDNTYRKPYTDVFMGAQGNPNPVATAPYAGGGSGTMTMGGRTIDVETASKPWYNATDITGTADPNVPGWDDLWI